MIDGELGLLARRLRRGEVSAVHTADLLLQSLTRAAGLNLIAELDPEQVLSDAATADAERRSGARLGRLHGVPLLAKANIHTGVHLVTAGTPALRRNRPTHIAEVVRRLRREGAYLAGTTSMHELAMGWTGDNPFYGAARNPADPRRLAGGSSGGSAGAVALGLVPAALGTDTNGSIRVPAAFCGVVGFRPSTGRYPLGGVVPLAPTLDTVGTVTRSVSDTLLLDAVLAGADEAVAAPSPGRLRIGIVRGYLAEHVDPTVDAAVERAATALAAAGVDVVAIDPPGIEQLLSGTTAALIRSEASPALAGYLGSSVPGLSLIDLQQSAGPDVAPALGLPGPADQDAYDDARRRQRALRSLVDDLFRRHRLDAILHAPVAMAAPLLATERRSPAPPVPLSGRIVQAQVAYGRTVAFGTLAGLPSLVLPVGTDADGLPLAIELDGARRTDRRLLAVGCTVEEVLAVDAMAFHPPEPSRP